MTRRHRTRISLFALTMGLCVALILSGCIPPPPPEPAPTFRFDILSENGEYNRQNDVTDFACFGLTEADFKNVLLPDKYSVSIDTKYNNDCSIFSSLIVVSLPGFPWDISSRDWIRANWVPAFVYSFPESFGWGGVLWVANKWEDGQSGLLPVAPSDNALVWSLLCADDAHCLTVVVRPSSIRYLAPNVNGVFDPVGIAVTLLETAWRRLSVERPDLVPISVPAVNPSPYVPLTAPPYPATSTPTPTDQPT